MNLLNSASFNRMERTLDAAILRHRVTVNNIANVDTPEFKRSDVQFEELLNSQLKQSTIVGKRTNARHIPIGASTAAVQPQIIQDQSSVMNNNSNNVDIDAEMSLMAKNQLRYNVVAQQVTHDIKNLRTAIGGR